MTREPPKDIIHKNYNNYLLELEEKKKQEDSKNFKFIAKPCPSDILAPKYNLIVEQAKIRQKENVNLRLNMWKTTLKPFSFDERDIKKQIEKKEKEERLKAKEMENKDKNVNKKKIDFRLVKKAAEDGYERYKKMKEIDNKAHMTSEHIFHPNIPKDIPKIYKINSKKYKELKEKKRIEQYREEQKEYERKARRAKQNELIIQQLKMQPTNTYRETRSSILRNKAKKEKDESENLYNEVESEIRQDKENQQLKIKNYVQDKLKDLQIRKYLYEENIKIKNMQVKKEQELLEKSYEEQLKNIYEDVNNNRSYLFEKNYEVKESKKKDEHKKSVNPIERFNSIIKTNGLDTDEFNVYI